MSDEIDRAQERDEYFRELALAEHHGCQHSGCSRTHCEECGDAIPEARRQAIPGCKLCVRCQQQREDILSHWRAL